MLWRHLRSNLALYSLLLVVFTGGLLVGIWMAPIHGRVFWGGDIVKNLAQASSRLTFLNAYANQLLWLGGLMLLGMTAVGFFLAFPVVFLKGYCLGFTFSLLCMAEGSPGPGFAAAALIPHNLIYLPCLLAAAVLAIRLSGSLINGSLRGNGVFTSLALYLAVFAVLFLLLALGSVVEYRFTPWLLRLW